MALLSLLAKPGERLTLEDISAWCDCEPSTIYRIEKRAIANARAKIARQNGKMPR